MAEEIKSVLGFDVSSALSQLEILDAALTKNATAFQSLGSSLDAFNTKGLTVPATLAKISVSAQQTINDLLGVQKAQASLANLGMGGASGTAIATAGGGPSVTDLLTKGAGAYTELEKAATSAGNAGKRAGDSMTLSWQTFARVIQTQLIIRGLNEIRDAMEFSVHSFLEYSKTISEIAAIDPNRKFDEISDSVRRMSDAFNQPLSKVAEAQYQILSAQFTTVADQTNIMTAANELAKVTNQGLDVSVNILTGSLNAYGETSDMAGLRAAQFFETVSLGRVRTGDLATALGRVQTIAHLSGVSLEELDAAMISLSIGGVKSTEAATQLRGVLTALLKPSQDMKAAFAEVGVASGPAAIATFGLQGAVQKLMETTGGAAEEMQKLMPNVRGFAGGARLAESGANAFNDALKKLQDLPANLLKQKEMELAATAAEKLTSELNKVKNALTVDVGRDLTESLQSFINVFGAEGIAGVFTSFLDQAPKVAAGLAMIAAGMIAIKIQSFLMAEGVTAAATRLIGLLALVPVAFAIGESIGKAITANLEAPAKKAEEILNQELKDIQNAARAKEQAEINLLNSKMQLLRQGLLGAEKIYIADVANFQKSMKDMEKSATASFSNIESARKSLSNELKSLSESEYASQEANSKKIGDIMARQSERNFERNLAQTGGDTQFQFDAYVKHANDLASAAAKLTAEAKDPAQKAAADEMWQRADAAAKTADQLAKGLNNTWDTKKAFELLTALDTKRVQSLTNQNILSGQIATDLEKRNATLAKNNEELEKLALEIQEKYKAIAKDEAAGDKGKAKLAKDMEDLKAMTAEYAAKTKSSIQDAVSGGFMADPKVFDKLKRDAERALTSIDIQNITILPSALETAFANLQTQTDKMNLMIPATVREGSGTDARRESSAIGVTQEYEKQQIVLIKQKGTLDQIDKDQTAIQNSLADSIARGNADIGSHQPGFSAKDNMRIAAAKADLHDLEDEIYRIGEKAGNITQQDINDLNNLIAKGKEAIDSGNNFTNSSVAAINAELTKQLEWVTQLIENQKKSDETIKQSIEDTKKQADTTDDVKAAADKVIQPIDQQITAITDAIGKTESLAEHWLNVASAAAQAAAASASANSAASGGGGGTSTPIDLTPFGGGGGESGPIITNPYFATGGAVRGTDSVHAMLDPHEVVMNPQASQRFAAQLIAMNAGLNPSYRSTGGSVSNTGISGDVNVSVTGAAQPQETAREVIKAINREQRRGTSKIRG